jgi:hypothetical protein
LLPSDEVRSAEQQLMSESLPEDSPQPHEAGANDGKANDATSSHIVAFVSPCCAVFPITRKVFQNEMPMLSTLPYIGLTATDFHYKHGIQIRPALAGTNCAPELVLDQYGNSNE